MFPGTFPFVEEALKVEFVFFFFRLATRSLLLLFDPTFAELAFALDTLLFKGSELWGEDFALLQEDDVGVLCGIGYILIRVVLELVNEVHDLEVLLLICLYVRFDIDERLCELHTHLDDSVVGHCY